jgi:hypothetical protein
LKLFVYSNNYITFAVQLTTRTVARRITERNIMNTNFYKQLSALLKEKGITDWKLEQSIGDPSFWRFSIKEELILADSACEDLYGTREQVAAFVLEYVKENI